MIRWCSFLTLLAAGATAALLPTSSPRPNILFILADDLGWGDLSCYGGSISTPHLDRLAAEGVRFTQFYANSAECTPTRAALLTGRYPQRVGGLECAIGLANVGRYDDAIRLREQNELGLPASFATLPRALVAAGYITASIGKWHLGYEPAFWPDRLGFHHWFGILGGGVDYFHHVEIDENNVRLCAIYRNGQLVRRPGVYMTDWITEEAIEWLSLAPREPWFLYLPYTAPHTPFQGPDDSSPEPVPHAEVNRGTPERYAAMLRRLDECVGRIFEALERGGVANRTLVVFTSDNGAIRPGSNGPHSGWKGSLMDGGIRVPCFVRWPGVLPAGLVSDQVGITMDWSLSLLRVAGADLSREPPLDGMDLLAHVRERRPNVARRLFWRVRRGDITWRAVRDGDLKLVTRARGMQTEFEGLFDLGADPGERDNLFLRRPDDVRRLSNAIAAWENEVRAPRP